MRICIAYDCLFPWTVGGAERWYRGLAERLAADGHQVTYLTRLQWSPNDWPDIPGVRVVAVSREEPLYGTNGNRRIGEALRYGWGILKHLGRHGADYDVVHTCSFPYFSLLAAGAVRPLYRYALVVDWFEVWSREYWRTYLGTLKGRIGGAVQWACARIPQSAHCFSKRHADRLVGLGMQPPPTLIGGLYQGDMAAAHNDEGREPLIVFAGRHIPEKRAPSVVAAIGELRSRGLDARGLILGDGPQREFVLEEISRLGLTGSVSAPGFVSGEELDGALGEALCIVQPSVREGYGLILVEAAAHGTPSVVVDHPDNASVELVEPGVNGVVSSSGSPADLAEAISSVQAAGLAMNRSTADWFERHAERLSLESSLARVSASYEPAASQEAP